MLKSIKIGLAIALVLSIAPVSGAFAMPNEFDQDVGCDVSVPDGRTFKGDCIYRPYEKGSFALFGSEMDFWGNVERFKVDVTSPGNAKVTMVPIEGKSVLLGKATRAKGSACWKGKNFKICATKK